MPRRKILLTDIGEASKSRMEAFAIRPFAQSAVKQSRYHTTTPESPRLVRFRNRLSLRQVHLCPS